MEGLTQLLTIRLVKQSFNPDLEIEGIVLTMFDPRNRISSQVEKEVRAHFGERVFTTVIPRNVASPRPPPSGSRSISTMSDPRARKDHEPLPGVDLECQSRLSVKASAPSSPEFAPFAGPARRRGRLLGLEEIHPNVYQPRRIFDDERLKELSDSIRRSAGSFSPVLVTRRPEGGYMLIAGERRWRAARLASLAEIPAIMKESSPADNRLEIA